MSNVTQLLEAINAGDRAAADQLLPMVYDELRALAAAKLARERPGQTLSATALVHEAYMRLAGPTGTFANRRHFFAAASEAMRRLLVDAARRKKRVRHGGLVEKADVDLDLVPDDKTNDEIVAVHEALDRLKEHDVTCAELVGLHYFAGLPLEVAGQILDLSPRTAYRKWAYARAWLARTLSGE